MGKKLILKASAGTGKTYRLSLEYIVSLVQGIDFKDILVMTFTKKATAEIKDRILIFLKDICENSEKREDIEKNIRKIYGEEFSFDIEKLEKIYKNIVENKDKLKIYTIDSFTNTVFKKAIAPFLKIYSYEIIDEEENRKVQVKTFEKIFENREDFNLFKSFLEDNSEKNMDIYVDLIGKIINQRWKLILIGDKIQEKSEFEYGDTNGLLGKMEEILLEVAEIKGKPFQDLIKKDCQKYFTAKDREEYLKSNYSAFLKDKFWNGTKVRTKKGDIDSHIADLNYLYDEFKGELGKVMYNNLVIPYESKLLRVVEKIYSIYDEIKFREKRFTHTDISSYTFKYLEERELGFLDEDGLTDEFFEVIDGKLKSIFIDEFQDTSILQWRILKNILAKSENIICVGDEKQSIYGWRGGEKRLFENLAQIIDGEEEELDTCFRSRENIVKYTNTVFREIAKNSEESESWEFSEVNYRDSDKKGYVKLITPEDERESIEIMIDEIEEKFHDNYAGIGILARTKKTLEKIAFYLGERGITYTLDSNASIVDSKGINGVYHLISWLLKKDFLSLLDFLRSDLINISAPTLKEIIKRRECIEEYLYSENDDVTLEIERDIFTSLKGLYDLNKKYDGETEYLTYEMLKSVGVGNRFQNEEDTLNIFGFYKLLKEYKYFDDFLIEYEENTQKDKFKKISTGNGNSVSLMTIHKSKGLEFDTLFYFIPSSSGKNADKGMEFYLEMNDTYSEVKSYLLTNHKFNNILKSIEAVDYLKDREIKQEHEEINNLYVALTRPKNNIYVVVENSEKVPYDILLRNMDTGELIVENREEISGEKGVEFTLDLSTPKVLYKEELEENQRLGLDKIYSHSLQIEGKRLRGIVVHYFLENILYWNETEIELAKKLTFSKYASLLGEKTIKEILSENNIEYIYRRCKNIFENDWDYVYREYPIYYKVGEESKNYRIDRLMIKLPSEESKGKILIADYKTGKFDEEQLENYTKVIVEKLVKMGKDIDRFEVENEYIELDV